MSTCLNPNQVNQCLNETGTERYSFLPELLEPFESQGFKTANDLMPTPAGDAWKRGDIPVGTTEQMPLVPFKIK